MATSVPLEPGTGHGWLVGFRNMVGKEWASWWSTRRWLVHLILWLVVINGFLFLIGTDESIARGNNPYSTMNELLQVFFQACGLFALIGMVVTTQSDVVGERQLGTAEWVLSKPVSRPAFLLSKQLVSGVSFLFLAVLIPSVVLFLQTLLHTALQPPLVPFLLGIAFHVLHLLFYLSFTLVLGVLFRTRGPVSGVAIGSLFAGLILPNMVPSVLMWTPWGLSRLAAQAARERPLPDDWLWPVAITVLWILLWLMVALRQFEREEF
jgi:ABC-2 type transport system permease protein